MERINSFTGVRGLSLLVGLIFLALMAVVMFNTTVHAIKGEAITFGSGETLFLAALFIMAFLSMIIVTLEEIDKYLRTKIDKLDRRLSKPLD